jgi:putative Holliday junction resolvase
MRILALDVGDRRVGVAISDPSGLLATPLTVVRRTSKAKDFATVARLVREQDAGLLVIGLPLERNGRAGGQARRIERYATELMKSLQDEELDLPCTFWDESLSTQRAQRAMIASGRKARDRRARLDAVAAAVILQDYLDAHRPAGMGLPEEETL